MAEACSILRYDNHLYYTGEITEIGIGHAIMEMLDFIGESQTSCEKSFYFHIHSDGGNAYAACRFMDFIENNMLPRFKCCCIVEGEACSAAAQMLIIFPKRQATKRSFIMFHETGWETSGLTTKHEVNTKLMQIFDRMCIDNIRLAGVFLDNEGRKELIKSGRYLDAKEALELGIIHEIIRAT